jgi:hypothetical protein
MSEPYYSNNPLDWTALDGLYIDKQDPPLPLTAGGAGVVGCVAELPWGPVDTPILIGAPIALVRAFFGYDTDPDYYYGDGGSKTGYKGCIGLAKKRWSSRGIYIVRVGHSGQAGAEKNLMDGATPAKIALTIKAKYPGKLGDRIQYKVTNNTSSFDLEVRWGDRAETYVGLTLTTMVERVGGNSDLVVVAAGESGAALPVTVSSWTNLAGGSDGTPAASDYAGSDVSKVGFRTFADYPDVELMFAAEFESDTLDAAMDAWLLERGYGVFFAGCAIGDALADAKAKRAALIAASDGSRTRICWPGLRVTMPNDRVVDTMSSGWQCAAAAQISPHRDIAAAGTKSAYTGCIALEDGVQITRADYIDALNHGIGAMEQLSSGGFKARSGIVADSDGRLLLQVRMADLIHRAEAKRLESYQNEPMDAEWKEGVRAAISDYLKYLQDPPRKMLKAFSVDDTSLNTESSEAAGEWYVVQKVQLYPPGRFIVVRSMIGTTVVITTETSGGGGGGISV